MKKTLICLLVLAVVFSACNKQNNEYNNNIELSNIITVNINNKKVQSMLNTINKPYEVSFSRVAYLSSLKEIGLGTIIRYNKNHFYSVDKLSDGKYVFLLLSPIDNDYVVNDGIIVSKLIERASFVDVKKGTKKSTIIGLDNNSVDFGQTSYHRFSDDSMIKIEYINNGSEYIANSIIELDNNMSVVHYLLIKDLQCVI